MAGIPDGASDVLADRGEVVAERAGLNRR